MHGFTVVDLGSHVSTERFLVAAAAQECVVVGLSAAITPVLQTMGTTVRALRKAARKIRIVVGGRAVTEGFAAQIEADGYWRGLYFGGSFGL